LTLKYQAPLSFEALFAFNENRFSGINVEECQIPLPFYPRDYNNGKKHEFKFSEEYLKTH
jgi:hypothetical protein